MIRNTGRTPKPRLHDVKGDDVKKYDITKDTPAGTFIKAAVGERFAIRMPEVHGRIIEPWLGSHTKVEHTCRSEGSGYVEFDMVAKEAGHDVVEFPLIEDGWNGAADPDPETVEPYASVLIVVLERRNDQALEDIDGGRSEE